MARRVARGALLSALYIETSALLSVILDSDREVERHLRTGDHSASALTFAEAFRVLWRDRRPSPGALRRIEEVRDGCRILPIDVEVLRRVERRFPVEPLRTLDAIHLATALKLAAVEPLTMLSTDRRLRENAVALGLAVLP